MATGGGRWYVVVRMRKDGSEAYCICDNANNRYNHSVKDIKYAASPYEAMRLVGWGIGDEKLKDLVDDRAIPVDIIAEVLAGCHDDRFDDWN